MRLCLLSHLHPHDQADESPTTAASGQDGWRHVGGRVCTSRPIRAEELDELVWGQVRRLLESPELVQAEIDRRLASLRTEHPATKRREALERDLTRAGPPSPA